MTWNRGLTVQIRGQEWNTNVSGFDDVTSLRIDLVEVVLRSRNIDVLNAVASRIHQRLRQYLFLTNAVEVARQLRYPDVTEVCARDSSRIHVVIGFIASSRVITTPGDCVRLSQCC